MKSLKFLIAVVALMLSFTVKSANLPKGTEVNCAIQKEIKSHLVVNAGESQKVEVIFTTDECGKVNLAIAKTENETLKQAIESNFLKLQFNNLKPENAYSVVLNLKLV